MPKRVDANQRTIVRALRSLGFSVLHLHAVGRGCPDLLVAGLDRRTGEIADVLVELRSKGGRLTEHEKEFVAKRPGPLVVAWGLEDILEVFGWEVE